MNIEQAYERVNAVKPTTEVKPMTFAEATAAVRKMYRHLTGRLFPYGFNETSGNRNTWIRGAIFVINVGRGWSDLIHSFSHWYHRANFPGDRPHSKRHARIEAKLRRWAVARGWMAGVLARPEVVVVPPTKSEERAKLIERRRAQIARLDRKIKALTTRRRTAARSLGALERAAAKE